MILTHIFKNKDKVDKENLGGALIFGIIAGLIIGGLALMVLIDYPETSYPSRMMYTFFIILFLSLTISLAIGGSCESIFVGLTTFLSMVLPSFLIVGIFPLANYYPTFIPIWFLVIVGLLLTELNFWLTPTKKLNKKQQKKKFGKTILLKLECLFEVFILLNILNIIRILINKLTLEILKAIWKWINVGLVWLGYAVGGAALVAIVLGILYLWVKLNEGKFE